MNQAATVSNLAMTFPGQENQDALSLIHPSCVIDPSVSIGVRVVIHANVVIDRNVKIGPGAVIHSGSYIGEDCVIGEGSVLHHAVTLREKTQVGARVVVESGVVIGSDGFGYAKEQNGVNCKIPQVGYVVLEDDVFVGANTTIDRATLGQTRIAKGSRIGSLVQVGHNVIVGENSEVGSGVGICGSCKIGSHVTIGHGVGMVGHIKIGDHSTVSDGSGVSKDIVVGGKIVGVPGMPEDEYARFQNYLAKLPELFERIHQLEKERVE